MNNPIIAGYFDEIEEGESENGVLDVRREPKNWMSLAYLDAPMFMTKSQTDEWKEYLKAKDEKPTNEPISFTPEGIYKHLFAHELEHKESFLPIGFKVAQQMSDDDHYQLFEAYEIITDMKLRDQTTPYQVYEQPGNGPVYDPALVSRWDLPTVHAMTPQMFSEARTGEHISDEEAWEGISHARSDPTWGRLDWESYGYDENSLGHLEQTALDLEMLDFEQIWDIYNLQESDNRGDSFIPIDEKGNYFTPFHIEDYNWWQVEISTLGKIFYGVAFFGFILTIGWIEGWLINEEEQFFERERNVERKQITLFKKLQHRMMRPKDDIYFSSQDTDVLLGSAEEYYHRDEDQYPHPWNLANKDPEDKQDRMYKLAQNITLRKPSAPQMMNRFEDADDEDDENDQPEDKFVDEGFNDDDYNAFFKQFNQGKSKLNRIG